MFVSEPPESDARRKLFEASVEEDGYVMNLARLWTWRTDVFEAFAALRARLTNESSLSPRELAVLVCSTASSLRDAYCSLAWGIRLARAVDPAAAAAVLRGTPSESLSGREQALAHWAQQVTRDPNATRAADVQALRDAGLDDREIFEATAFVAFRLAFSTVNDALGARPDWQLAKAAPAAVRDAVTYGRATAAPQGTAASS